MPSLYTNFLPILLTFTEKYDLKLSNFLMTTSFTFGKGNTNGGGVIISESYCCELVLIFRLVLSLFRVCDKLAYLGLTTLLLATFPPVPQVKPC